MRLSQITSILATGDQTGLVLWATIEMNVGVSCNPHAVTLYVTTRHCINNSQISLTCFPTLIPLIKHYGNKNTSRTTYGIEDTQGHSLRFLKIQTHTNVVANEPPLGWTDRDSSDNSSQKQILGLQGPLPTKPHSKGITTTREVHVEIKEDDTKERMERNSSQ